MNYLKFTFYVSLILTCSCSPKTQPSPSGASKLSEQLVTSVLWYQSSAEMVALYLQGYRYAELMLDAKLDTMFLNKPAAVVLDIDETVLDNSPYEVYLIRNNLQYGQESWKKWTNEERAAPLPGALEFVQYAKQRGVQVFYISNRRVNELTATINNLQKHGFPNAQEKFVMLRSNGSDKTERREQVSSAYQVLVFVGDNLADYDAAYSNRSSNYGKDIVTADKDELLSNFVILPNPMYGDWEGAIYNNNFTLSDEEKLRRRREALID